MLQRLAAGPASVAELADAAGVHENTARPHVAALERGGLVRGGARPAAGPGRPGVQYRVTSEGERIDQDFLGVAELLAAVVSRSGMAAEELQDIGREWGRYLVGRPGRYDPAERIPTLLGRVGFEAEVRDDRVLLRGCPCPLVSVDRPELVCRLASGVVEGILAAVGSGQTVGEEEHDPGRRRCRLALVARGRGAGRPAS
jgi:predicted ArsR family transcriptional regulator